jgi:quinol monooxygenase YgiN
MITLNVHLTVKDEADVPKIRELLKLQCQLSKQEPGCLRFNVYHSQAQPKFFILNEHWESMDALEAHRKAHAYLTVYAPQVIPLVDRTPHFCDLVE